MAEETQEMAEETKLKTHTCVRLYQDIVKARTNDEFQAAMDDAVPVNHDKNQQLMYSLEKDCFRSEASTRRINVSNSVNLYFVFDISDCHFN